MTISCCQAKRPRDPACPANRRAATVPAIPAPTDTPARNQKDHPCDHLSTARADNSAAPLVPIGVGFDTSRYGHYAAFLHDQLQPAGLDFIVVESGLGLSAAPERLDGIAAKHAGLVHFRIICQR